MTVWGVLAGLATGFSLGLLGSGGSIIALPALVYLLGVASKSALAMSLGVVGVTAALAAADHGRHGNVDVPAAGLFALFGVGGSLVGSRIGMVTPVLVQMTLFALVMYAAAWRMLRHASAPHVPSVVASRPAKPFRRVIRIALAAVGVGLLTGLVGVGGGFLVVPALVLFSGLTMKRAIGTSLAVVAANAGAGFYGYLGKVPIDWTLMEVFVGTTLLGSVFGTQLSSRLSHGSLKRGFAWFLVFVASYILLKNN